MFFGVNEKGLIVLVGLDVLISELGSLNGVDSVFEDGVYGVAQFFEDGCQGDPFVFNSGLKLFLVDAKWADDEFSSEVWFVFRMNDEDVLYRVDGYYDSYDGITWGEVPYVVVEERVVSSRYVRFVG